MGYKWKQHRETCRRLYVDEGKSLTEVRQYMAEHHNFTPSPRAFQHAFSRWGFPNKLNPAYKNEDLVARVRGLWEQNMAQRRMVEVLQSEGYAVGEREVARIRSKNGWKLRGPNYEGPSDALPGRQWAHDVGGGGGGGADDGEGDGDATGLSGGQGNHEDQSDHWNYGAAGLEAPEAQLQHETLDAMREARREHRRRQLEAESDELWLAKKRRRRTQGYGILPADPPGPPRFPSETSLTEAKAILQLDKKDVYMALRDKFYNMLVAANVYRKRDVPADKWEALKDQLVRESMHLRSVMWDPADMDKKRLAVEIMCGDVTKKVRDGDRKMRLSQAKVAAGLNPDEVKQATVQMYNILVHENFTSKIEEGPELFEVLKQRWIAGSERLSRIVAEDPSVPGHARRMKAVAILANDATRRYRTDLTRLGRVPPAIHPQVRPPKPRAKPKAPPAESAAAATAARAGGGAEDEAMPAFDSPEVVGPEMEPEEVIATTAAAVTVAPREPPASLPQPRKRGRPVGSRNRKKQLPHVQARLVLADLEETGGGQQPAQTVPTPFADGQQTHGYPAAQPPQQQPPVVQPQEPPPQAAPPAASGGGGLAAFFRLHPTSTVLFPGGAQRQWIAALPARTMEAVRGAALQAAPGGLCDRVEGVVRDGRGGELPLPVSDEAELETYLLHVEGGGGAPTFCVRIVPSPGG